MGSGSSPLANRLVEVAREAISKSEDAFLGMPVAEHVTVDPYRMAANAATVALLRELVGEPDGYLRHTEDGGITYTRTLRALADEIEKGET